MFNPLRRELPVQSGDTGVTIAFNGRGFSHAIISLGNGRAISHYVI